LVPTRPVRRSTSCGHSTDTPTRGRSLEWPSLDFRSPSEPITGNPCRPAGLPAGRTTLPLLDFSCPTTQSQAGGYVDRQQIHPPPRGHVRGLVTPFAALTSGPPDACASERPWASPFKVFPSSQSVPLSGPMPSCRHPLPPRRPEGLRVRCAPASRPCSCDESVQSPGSRVIPAVDPFLGFYPPEPAPIRPGARFGRGASPLTLGRLDVQGPPGPQGLVVRMGG
jgi:hypothetical protein